MMRRFLKSLAYALSGIRAAVKSEQSFRLHILAMVVSVAMGLYLKLSMTAWGFVIFAIGFVMAAELFNTALERLGDEAADGEQKQIIKKAKDTSAGAVLVSALTALVIGIMFLLIPFVQRIVDLIQSR
jgi:diacylglycerol kinase